MIEDRPVEAEAVARDILKSRFGVAHPELTRNEEGESNYVFEVETPAGPIVLRVGLWEEKGAHFVRERCVVERVRKAGIPAPEVIGEGEAGAWAYMAVRRVAGQSATSHLRRLDILREAGRLAATKIHRIRTVGYGFQFALDGDCGEAQPSWRAWLDDALGAAERLDRLREHRIVSDAQLAALDATLDEVRRWQGEPVLNHGDLRLKNLLVDEHGSILAILDWERCVSSIGPHWDLSVSLHDLSIDEKEAFLDGYGMSAPDVRQFAPVWRLFNAINYVPHVERLLTLHDEDELERVRNRFSGALDLYAS